MRKTTALLIFVLTFGLSAFGQNVPGAQATLISSYPTYEKPKLPESYGQWPNVFQRREKLDEKNTLVWTVFVKLGPEAEVKIAGFSEKIPVIETLQILELNRRTILTTYSGIAVGSNSDSLRGFSMKIANNFLIDGRYVFDDTYKTAQVDNFMKQTAKYVKKEFGVDGVDKAIERMSQKYFGEFEDFYNRVLSLK